MWVRMVALPYEAPLRALLESEAEKAEADAKEAKLHAMLAKFRPQKG